MRSGPLDRRALARALALARRRARWLLRPPRVKGAVPPMLPGALRLGREEEEAAVDAVREVMRSRNLFRYYGPARARSRVRQLERAFAKRTGVEHALAVNSGTSALVCGLVGLGIGPGDEVIVPAYTWFSTPSAVVAAGAVPIVAEVDDSLTLDLEDVRRKLSPHTRAVVPVHMRGAPARMDALVELARERGLAVLEDAAQAAGGSFRGRALGGIGDVGAHSFQMSKIMTAGEGGMVTTSDSAVHLRAAMYHDTAVCPHMGVPASEWLPGLNLRMSELHAAVLLVQLGRLEGILADVRERRARLEDAVRGPLEERGVRFRTVHDPEGDTCIALVFFLPDAERAEKVAGALARDNVPASRLYHDLSRLPHDHVDLHAYPAWAPILERRSWSPAGGPWRGHPRHVEYAADACPVTVDLLRRAIHVDVSPDLRQQQVGQMAAAIVEAVRRHV